MLQPCGGRRELQFIRSPHTLLLRLGNARGQGHRFCIAASKATAERRIFPEPSLSHKNRAFAPGIAAGSGGVPRKGRALTLETGAGRPAWRNRQHGAGAICGARPSTIQPQQRRCKRLRPRRGRGARLRFRPNAAGAGPCWARCASRAR